MVAGLIIQNGKLLLLHNTKHGGVRVEPPGGKVEAGETLREAAAREIKEELGINVSVGRLFGNNETDSPEGKFTVYMYFCTINSGEPETKEPDKSTGFDWYSLEQLRDLQRDGKLVPNMVEALSNLVEHLT